MTKPKIQEVIIVEGKDDTTRIKLAVDADTIETNGSAIDKTTLATIKHASDLRGVIIFTDPDYPGERIRSIISQAVPKAKHAFITRDQAFKSKEQSLGIEHASVEVIRQALGKVYTPAEEAYPAIPLPKLRALGLVGVPGSKELREQISEDLSIGHVNGKQLAKRLQMFHISEEELIQSLNKFEN